MSRYSYIAGLCRAGSLAAALFATSVAAQAGDNPAFNPLESSSDLLQPGLPHGGFDLRFPLSHPPEATSVDVTAPAAAPRLDEGAFSVLNWPGPQLSGAPRHDIAVVVLRMGAATYGLRYSVDDERPGSGYEALPSGQTASAFMGAEFIRREYGWSWAGPAYAAAGWISYSRVDSGRHDWRDVLAGALIGIAANHDFRSIRLPLGELSIGPTMIAPDSMAQPALSGAPVPAGFDFHPGLQILWIF